MSDPVPPASGPAAWRTAVARQAKSPDHAALRQALSDPHWLVRAEAVRRAAHGGASDGLLWSALGDPVVPVRRLAAEALKRPGGSLGDLLAAQDGYFDPLSIAQALGKTGRREAVAPLTGLLAALDAEVRRAAAEALGELAWPDAALAIRARLGKGLNRPEKDQGVRTALEAALKGLRKSDLPRPSKGHGELRESLPIPATGAAPDVAQLPIPDGRRRSTPDHDAGRE